MLGKNVILVILFIACYNANAQKWTTVVLNDFAKIDLPKDFTIENQEKSNLVLFYKDSLYTLSIRVKEFSNRKENPMARKKLLSFYEDLIDRMFISDRKRLVVKKEFEIAKLEGVEVLYSSYIDNLYPVRTKRLLFYKHFLFDFEFTTPAEQQLVTASLKRQFFNSFSISVD